MTSEQIGGLIRTLLGFAAGFAVSKGWLDKEQAPEIIGALVVVGVAVWSWWQKHVAAKTLAVATLAEPSPAAADAAKAVLTPQEITRAIHPTLPTAVVTATGKVL